MKKTANQNSEKIKSAALQLFQEKGYDKVTISEICKAAGCSLSTFYYQFGTKEHLLLSYINFFNVVDQSILSSLLMLTGAWERLWKIHLAFVDTVTMLGPSLFGKLYSSYMVNGNISPQSDRINSSIESMIIPLISQGQENGEIRNLTSAEELATTVSILMRGVSFSWCTNQCIYDLKAQMKKHLGNLYDLRDDLRDR